MVPVEWAEEKEEVSATDLDPDLAGIKWTKSREIVLKYGVGINVYSPQNTLSIISTAMNLLKRNLIFFLGFLILSQFIAGCWPVYRGRGGGSGPRRDGSGGGPCNQSIQQSIEMKPTILSLT